MTTRPGMPCGYAFRVGTRYLIFANRSQDDDQLYMLCGLIRPSDGASGMVRYLESLSAPDAGGRVWGRILMNPASGPAFPMASIRVTVSGPRAMEAVTGADGEFEFVALPPGSYSMGVAAPDRPDLWFPTREVRMDGAYACREIVLLARTNSRVEGRIADQNGAAIPRVDVTLRSMNKTANALAMNATATTDDQGSYSFDGLPEGLYAVHVRAVPDRNGLAPLTADPIEAQLTRQATLAPGGHAVLEPIRLQRFVRISLTGRVIDANGAGLGGVALWVVALDDRSRWSRRFVTDQEGRFSVPVYAGRRQQLIVGDRQEPRANVTVVAGNEPVVIRVGPP